MDVKLLSSRPAPTPPNLPSWPACQACCCQIGVIRAVLPRLVSYPDPDPPIMPARFSTTLEGRLLAGPPGIERFARPENIAGTAPEMVSARWRHQKCQHSRLSWQSSRASETHSVMAFMPPYIVASYFAVCVRPGSESCPVDRALSPGDAAKFEA